MPVDDFLPDHLFSRLCRLLLINPAQIVSRPAPQTDRLTARKPHLGRLIHHSSDGPRPAGHLASLTNQVGTNGHAQFCRIDSASTSGLAYICVQAGQDGFRTSDFQGI